MHRRTRTIAVFVCAACAVTLLPADKLHAQSEIQRTLEEIVVVGTRRGGRTVVNSPVPIDIVQGSEFQNMGTTDMNDMLRTLIPSYNVERQAISDEASLVRPATLRGLPAIYTLVLVNGKRLHRSGALGAPQAPDIATIPAIGIQRVEVLRDGASAQYGSDAIAGVLNFVVSDASEGFAAEYRYGEFYAGDGASNQFGINAGLPLTENGFINLSLEYGNRDGTSVAVQETVPAALQALGAQGIPNPVQDWGQPKMHHEIKTLFNAALDLGDSSEVYFFGNYANREQDLTFFWRNPNNTGGIFTVNGPERLVIDVTPDSSGNCPLAGTPNAIVAADPITATQAEYDADQAALAALAADPNCWVANEVHPAGYRPLFGAEQTDYSVYLGVRGNFGGDLTYDFSGAYGTNELDFYLRDTINASMGPQSPTSFSPGITTQIEKSINADFTWPVAIDAFSSPLNVAFGAEWRDEIFDKTAGDQPSWESGQYASFGATTGSHGFPGISPPTAGRWNRANWAVYLDLEADITEKFLLGLALRHEEFDDFGATSNYKVSTRYAFNDVFAIRGSLNTGFIAPTPADLNNLSISTFNNNGTLLQFGLFPAKNPVSIFYGAEPLEPEESENFSIGFSLQPTDKLVVTVDYFDIDIDNRIQVGPRITLTPEDIALLEAQGIAGAGDLFGVRYLTNTSTKTTRGVDLVATYQQDWQRAGNSDISIAWNYTDYEWTADENISRRGYINESGSPANRGIFTVNHYWNNLRFLLRASYYDDWVRADFGNGPLVPVCTDERPNPSGTDQCYGDEWIVDAEIAYTFNERFSLIVGADNVFDEHPDFDFDYPDQSRGRLYPAGAPSGYNGGFWYLRLRADF